MVEEIIRVINGAAKQRLSLREQEWGGGSHQELQLWCSQHWASQISRTQAQEAANN